jgi:hypothetical protein
MFPGAGTSNAGQPLQNGMLCDAVAGNAPVVPEQPHTCYVNKNDPTQIAATLEQVLECAKESNTNTVHLRLTFHPWFVDNTYGAGSIGWPVKRGHWFVDLVRSDHAELLMNDADGKLVLQFKVDYFSKDASRPSGYGSLGVSGGDGAMITGDASNVVKYSTSLDRNFNERGYSSYTVDSPLTDKDYSPNPATPEWDYRVVYEVWVKLDAFGSAGFGGSSIEYVHASPAKGGSDTIDVVPGKCPPCDHNNPDNSCSDAGTPPPPPPGCDLNNPDNSCSDAGTPPPPPPGCDFNIPDNHCSDAGTPGSGHPLDCTNHPEDPACKGPV